MTDANLADQIERWLADDPDHMGLHSLSEAQWRGIAAAMRRQPSSDQVLVPREASDEICANAYEYIPTQMKPLFSYAIMRKLYNGFIAAAESEVSKP